MTAAPETGDLRLLGRLLREARPWWPHIAGVFAVGLLGSALALLAPLPVKIAVDCVLGAQPLPEFLRPLVPEPASGTAILVLAVGLIVAVAVAGQIQGMADSWLRTWTGERLVLDFRARLLRHAVRLSFARCDARGTADSLYRIQHDAASLQSVAVDGIIPFITSAVTVGAMLYVSARIDWGLALVAVAITPPLLAVLAVFRGRLRRRSREIRKLESASLGVVQEVLAAIRVVKAFGQADRERRRFVGRSAEALRGRLRLILAEGGLGLITALLIAAGTSAFLYMGVRHVQAGVLSLGDLLLVLGYLAQLYSPLRSMSRRAARLQTHLSSAERAYALLDEPGDVAERPGARPLARARGAVELLHVGFGYGEGAPALEDLNLSVAPGTRVGLSGRTGAGKTTLVSLLTRFYDPTEGAILLDGVDLRDWRLDDLRRQFAIVLQEPLLFSTSIAENIVYGRPGASRAEIADAAEAAGAAAFIDRLPQGYETPVGERGMRLSGGERQRIALARAFLRDAPILILDEPTSSVDLETEAMILGALEKLMRGRTTFLIAHRPGTLELCDLIVKLEHGRLVSVRERERARRRPPPDARGAGRAATGLMHPGDAP